MYSLVDLTHLKWGTAKADGGSYGAYYKATSVENGVKYYYKCSCFYSGQDVFGDESAYEVICSRLLRALGFNCIDCTLVYAMVKIDGRVYKTFVSKSADFTKGVASRVSLESLANIKRIKQDGSNQLEFLNSLGEELVNAIQEMLIADFLTIQRDRHGSNIELLFKRKKYTLAPMFDNGVSFLAPYPSAFDYNIGIISEFDVLSDLPVNNYIGTRSLFINLKLLTFCKRLNALPSRRSLFYNLSDVLPTEYLDKIWEIITVRYDYLIQKGIIC